MTKIEGLRRHVSELIVSKSEGESLAKAFATFAITSDTLVGKAIYDPKIREIAVIFVLGGFATLVQLHFATRHLERERRIEEKIMDENPWYRAINGNS